MNITDMIERKTLEIISRLIQQWPCDDFREVRLVARDFGFRIVAVGTTGEPHRVEAHVVSNGDTVRTEVVSCEHWETIAEEILKLTARNGGTRHENKSYRV